MWRKHISATKQEPPEIRDHWHTFAEKVTQALDTNPSEEPTEAVSTAGTEVAD